MLEVDILITSILIRIYIDDTYLRVAVTNHSWESRAVRKGRGDDKRHHRLARRYDGEIHNCHHF